MPKPDKPVADNIEHLAFGNFLLSEVFAMFLLCLIFSERSCLLDDNDEKYVISRQM